MDGSLGVLENPPSLSAMLSLAAMLLGLSVATQVVQELYKYLTSSKARAFKIALADFAGPWTKDLFTGGSSALMQVRGPFQFFKSKPSGVFLPTGKKELLSAFDDSLGDWLRYGLAILKRENQLQEASADGSPREPSHEFRKMQEELSKVDPRSPGFANARRLVSFFKNHGTWNPGDGEDAGPGGGESQAGGLDSGFLLQAFYQEFFPERVMMEERYSQFKENFQYTYERRNLRQTVLLSLGLALAFNFPFDELYRQATKLSPDEAVALAERMLDLSEKHGLAPAPPDEATPPTPPAEQPQEGAEPEAGASGGTNPQADANSLHDIISALDAALGRKPDGDRGKTSSYLTRGYRQIQDKAAEGSGSFFQYIFNCLVTAVFVSFGAPFWHRMTTSLLGKARGSASPDGATAGTEKEE